MIAELPPNFLQSKEWAKTNELIGHKILKASFGPTPTYMIVKNAKRGRYLEIPGGPLLDWSDPSAINKAFAKIRTLAQENKCVFVRLRPQLLKTPENLALLAKAGAVPAPMHLHAEHTIIIDLTKSEEDLLSAMRRQTRYEVRRALKLGLTVKKSNTESTFREFHTTQSQTAARQHFIPPDLKTLLAERKAFGEKAQIYISYSKNESPSEGGDGSETASTLAPIAYALVLIGATEAAYFEAASTDLNRKLPGAYALQWQIIKDLKSRGIKSYNLWGIAPPGAKNHRYSGVTTFKSGFGGEVIEFIPAHDLIISKTRYKLDLAIETLRKKRRNL